MPIRNLKLFAVSFVMLFLEILLIRWISTRSGSLPTLSTWFYWLVFWESGWVVFFPKRKNTIGLLVLIALAVRSEPFRHITDMLSGFSDSVIWYQAVRTGNLIPALQGAALTL